MANISGGLKEIFMYVLGAFVVGMGCGIVFMLIRHEIPVGNRDIVNVSLGAVLGMSISVVNYFFGSSKSSADKTEMIHNSTPIQIDNSKPSNENAAP